MRKKYQYIRDSIIQLLAIAMLIVLWVFILDGIFHSLWRNLVVILSILIFAGVSIPVRKWINLWLDRYPVVCILLQYGIIVLLFYLFSHTFHWFDQTTVWNALLYTIPIFLACYALQLVGTKRDEKYINERLQRRKQHTNSKPD